ncbi:restriction endonuclease subunit S [Streptomyces sp. NBRC 110028]|uniref:restriction endonuclease subunit S n=1 Tax=Streptomyces sp. NBRC 110028 TaxID=1621260 RepID=UPI00099E8D3B|nr:restriction endonuclease subunit S [Streptomyces sp. NBRC 110028]
MRADAVEVRHVPVGELGEVRMGKQLSPASRAAHEQFPYLRVANVFDGYIDYSNIKSMGFTQAEREIYTLRSGDILLNEGQSLELVGRSALYDHNDNKLCFQNTLIRFRAGAEVMPEYAQAVFSRWLETGVFSAIAKKTTSIAHLGADRFSRLLFPLPPLQEQRKVTQVIESMTAREKTIKASIAKLGAIRSSLREELNETELDHLGTIITFGPQNGLYKPESAYGGNGTPIVRIDSFTGGPSDLTRGLLRVDATPREIEHYGISAGDIIINRVNTPGLVGKSTMVSNLSEPTIFESNMMRCRVNLDKALPEFVEAWLSSATAKTYFRTQAKSAISQASINQHDIRACPFPRLNLNEQRAFLRRLTTVGQRIAFEEAALHKMKMIKQGIVGNLLNS